jgi:hypothetical protein
MAVPVPAAQVMHDQLVRAFLGIEDKHALAWSILDERSERAVSSAISLSANRSSREGRVACVEYRPHRLDLAFMTNRVVHSTCQAKSVYLGDYTEKRIAKRDEWLGGVLNADFDKLAKANRKIGSVRGSGCVFYLYELADPSRQLKYAVHANEVSVEAAMRRELDPCCASRFCILPLHRVEVVQPLFPLALECPGDDTVIWIDRLVATLGTTGRIQWAPSCWSGNADAERYASELLYIAEQEFEPGCAPVRPPALARTSSRVDSDHPAERNRQLDAAWKELARGTVCKR